MTTRESIADAEHLLDFFPTHTAKQSPQGRYRFNPVISEVNSIAQSNLWPFYSIIKYILIVSLTIQAYVVLWCI